MVDEKSGVMHLTDDSLLATVNSEERPVLVDFYADWCGPCVAAAPVIEKLAGEYKDKILITKLNVDEQPKSAQQYGVMSIPTVLIFKKGAKEPTIIGKQIGYPGEAGYRNLIENALES
jgi:thioredoxin 1